MMNDPKDKNYLSIKTLVSFKYNGILCHGCVQPLSRSKRN